jgi:hypothetical protein
MDQALTVGMRYQQSRDERSHRRAVWLIVVTPPFVKDPLLLDRCDLVVLWRYWRITVCLNRFQLRSTIRCLLEIRPIGVGSPSLLPVINTTDTSPDEANLVTLNHLDRECWVMNDKIHSNSKPSCKGSFSNGLHSQANRYSSVSSFERHR